MSSFKSSEDIQTKEDWPDCIVSNNEFSSVTLNELAMKARESTLFCVESIKYIRDSEQSSQSHTPVVASRHQDIVSRRMLVLSYRIQRNNKHFITFYIANFKILDKFVLEKSLKKIHMHTKGVREETRENVKKKETKVKGIMILVYTITWPPFRCIQSFNFLSLKGADLFVTESFIGEKEKWTNKGNDNQKETEPLIHDINCHIQFLYQFEIKI